MDQFTKTCLWHQMGAAIDMLDEAFVLCPDNLWTENLWHDDEDPRYGTFWFIGYHCIFWTDCYLSGGPIDFKPPAPFIRPGLPEHPYRREDIRAYLASTRLKAKQCIAELTDERARWISPWDMPYLEHLFGHLRHIQEHGAQLNLFLGQHGVTGHDWIPRTQDELAQ